MAFVNRSSSNSNGGSVRRLIRPSLPEFKQPTNRRLKPNNNGNNKNRAAPPEQTNAENYYYLKQMNAKTPMVVIMTDGEEIRGSIEWYDRSCIKLNRDGAPNLVIQKHCIKYLFKEEELREAGSD